MDIYIKKSHGFFSVALELLHLVTSTLCKLNQLNRNDNRLYIGKSGHLSFEIMEQLPYSLHPPCSVKEIES